MGGKVVKFFGQKYGAKVWWKGMMQTSGDYAKIRLWIIFEVYERNTIMFQFFFVYKASP